MRFLKYILYLVFVSSFVTSCQDEVLNLEPLANPTDVTFFADESQLQLAVNGIYGRLASPSIEGLPIHVFMENMLTDNALYRLTDGNNGLRALSNSEHDPSSGFTFYSDYYRAIGRANNMLNNMDRAEGVEQEKFNDLKAQALALRAYYYHWLIQFWGDVPYIDFLPNSPTDGFIDRTPKATIVQILYTDLDDAATLIDNSLTGIQDRITKAIIHGLKARIALYNEDYDIAAQEADKALAAAQAQGLALHPDYAELFSPQGQNSPEIMLRIPYDETFRTHHFPLRMGYRFGSIFSQALPTQNLVDAYPTINGLPIDQDPSYAPTDPWTNRDPRMRASIVFPQDLWGGYIHESHRDSLKTTRFIDDEATRVTNENCRSAQWPAGLTGYLWKKFVDIEAVASNQSRSDNDFYLMRLGEIYLIKAEAEIERGGDLVAAANALNTLRKRAWGGGNYPTITENTQAGLRKILRMERRIELANEGFRYIDLIRWNIIEKARAEPLIGRVLDLANATNGSIPSIDQDGVVTYPDRSEYDDWRSLLVNGEIVPDGYDSRLNGNWQNAHQRNFIAPKDYLLPIPQAEVDLYENNGFSISQNPGY